MKRRVLVYVPGLKGRTGFLPQLKQAGFNITLARTESQLFARLNKHVIHVLVIKYQWRFKDRSDDLLDTISNRYPSSNVIMILGGDEAASAGYSPAEVLLVAITSMRRGDKGRKRAPVSQCYLHEKELDAALCGLVEGLFESEIRIKHSLTIWFILESTEQLCNRVLSELEAQFLIRRPQWTEENITQLRTQLSSPTKLGHVISVAIGRETVREKDVDVICTGSYLQLRSQGYPKLPKLYFQFQPSTCGCIQIEREGPRQLFTRFCNKLTDSFPHLAHVQPSLLREEFENVLGKIFYGDNGVKGVRVTKLREFAATGASDTLTLRLTPIIERQRRTRSVILKFGPAETKINREAERFEKYVQWHASLSQSVYKLAHASWNYTAGLVYNFVADRIAPVKTDEHNRFARVEVNEQDVKELSVFVREQPSADTCSVIERMFECEKPSGWYEHLSKREPATLHDYFHQEWLKGKDDSYFRNQLLPWIIGHCWRNAIKEIQHGKYLELRAMKDDVVTQIRNPCDFFGQRPNLEVKYCICHGDLHADNVFIDCSTGAASPAWYFIDYYYTGEGDIFKDFTELELAVRYAIFLSSKAGLDSPIHSLKRVEDALAQHDIIQTGSEDTTFWKASDEKGESPEQKCSRIIRSIRIAARNLGVEVFREKGNGPVVMAEHYYWNLFYAGMKRLLYTYRSAIPFQGYLTVAGAAAEKLENLCRFS